MADKQTKYVFGTDRRRTELDNWLDEYILDNHYKKTGERKTAQIDKEVLEKTYLKPLK